MYYNSIIVYSRNFCPNSTKSEEKNPMKKLLLILNPVAGTKKANRYLSDILKLFCQSDYECTVCLTTDEKRADTLVCQSGKDKDIIVCIGGDGTFNETISGMVKENIKTPLGYIPTGSTNDFATSINLASSPMTAAKNILTGKAKTFDIGYFNNRIFTYVASFGSFTKTSYNTSRDLKNALGHFAYLLEGIKEIGDIRPEKLVIEHDGKEISGNYVFGAICNSTRVGGGVLKFSQDSIDMNDGMFEIILIKNPKNPAELMQLLFDLQSGNYNGELFEFFKSDSFKIKTNENMPWTIDGEYEKGCSQIDIKVVKSAFSLIIPN